MPDSTPDAFRDGLLASELYDEQLAEADEDYEAGHAPAQGKARWVGTTERRKRTELAAYERFLELRRDAIDAEVDFDEEALRQQALRDVKANPLSDEDMLAFHETAPTSTINGCPQGAMESLVHRAVLMLPWSLWLYALLSRQLGRRGYDAARKCVAATFLFMAFGRDRPEIWETRQRWRANLMRCWAWEFPEDDLRATPSRGRFYDSTHEALLLTEPEVAQELMVDAFMRVARQTRGLDRQGRPIPRHRRAGLALVADGSFAESHVAQNAPPDKEEGRLIQVGFGREKVWFISYGQDGYFRKKSNGLRLVALVDQATGLCVIAAVCGGKAHEPDEVLKLLERLFELAPDFPPVSVLIGDRLYGHSKRFLRELIFRFGIHPCFPWRADYPDAEHHGVPHCNCTGEELPMVFVQWKDRFWDQEKRLKSTRRAATGELDEGEPVLPRVAWCSLQERRARLEFECPRCKAPGQRRGQRVTTRPWDDPRIYTFLPHVGEGPNASLRRALSLRRGVIESLWAALHRQGLAGKGLLRPAWAKDREMEWLLLTGLLFLTWRRLVFENGLYDYAEREAEELGLFEPLTLAHPDTGLEMEALANARSRRTQVLITSEGISESQAGESPVGDPHGDDVVVAAVPQPPRNWAVTHPGATLVLPFGSMAAFDPPPGREQPGRPGAA